jgi:restriction system protein
VGDAFRRRRFDVQGTGRAVGDGGYDLVLAKRGRRYLAQCKHCKVERVGVRVVRESNGIIAARGAAGGFVVMREELGAAILAMLERKGCGSAANSRRLGSAL